MFSAVKKKERSEAMEMATLLFKTHLLPWWCEKFQDK